MNTPSWLPSCPNHGERLEGIPFPMPAQGTGICPVSGCPFEYSAETDEQKVVIDKFGNPTKTLAWKVSGEE